MSKLKAFNLVLQFTGFRLCRTMENGEQIGWGLMGPVLPLTGWGTDYVGWPSCRLQWT